MARIAEAASGEPDYALSIRSAARGLWSAAIDYYDFFDAMTASIRRGLTRAWHEGAASAGIEPDELTPEEKLTMENAIVQEWSHVHGFAIWIEANSKARDVRLGVVLARAALWAGRYRDVVNLARTKASNDPKLKWQLGPTVEHCSTCETKLDGKVKRASYWTRMGVRPQNPPNDRLECKGWRCACELIPTTEPGSKGPLPRLP